MDCIVVIPARGGSKGIPGKNSKILGNKPLIQYTIEAALAVFPAERIIVSTDDEAIKQAAEDAGVTVPFLRPEHLATDTASSYDVILHAMEYADASGISYDTVVLLQPTSPFRTGIHLKEALALYTDSLDMVVSVKEAEENPYYSLFEEGSNGLLHKSKEGKFTRRQDCPPVYRYNGAIYIMNANSLREKSIGEFTNVKKYVMSNESSIDLDSPLDWKIAELLLSNK